MRQWDTNVNILVHFIITRRAAITQSENSDFLKPFPWSWPLLTVIIFSDHLIIAIHFVQASVFHLSWRRTESLPRAPPRALSGRTWEGYLGALGWLDSYNSKLGDVLRPWGPLLLPSMMPAPPCQKSRLPLLPYQRIRQMSPLALGPHKRPLLTFQQIPLTPLKSLNIIDLLGLYRSCSVHDNHIHIVIKSSIKIKDQIVDLSI